MRIESKVKYRIELRHDNGILVLNAFNDNGLIGDGVTMVADDIWNSVYKNNHGFLDKCERRGSITWVALHVDTPKEEEAPKGAKKGGKKKAAQKVEEPVVETAVEELPAEEEVKDEPKAEEEKADDNDFIEG